MICRTPNAATPYAKSVRKTRRRCNSASTDGTTAGLSRTTPIASPSMLHGGLGFASSGEPRHLQALEKLTEEPGDDERRPVRAVPRVLHGSAESGRGLVQGQLLDDAEHERGPVQGIEPQEDRPGRFRKLVLVECRTG